MLIVGSATLEATKGHRIVAITPPVHELRGGFLHYASLETNAASHEAMYRLSILKIAILLRFLGADGQAWKTREPYRNPVVSENSSLLSGSREIHTTYAGYVAYAGGG